MTDNSLAGYMIPEHNGSEYSRSMFLARTLLANLRTMMPVRVVKVYKQDGKSAATRGDVAGAGFIDAQPVISQIDGQGTRVDHVTIYHIPYTRIYGGDAAIIMDPVVGDIGYVKVADRDISTFRDQITQGNTTLVTPGSNRRHSLSDSIYVGGVLNKTPKQYVTFANGGITINDVNGSKIVWDSNGITITPFNSTVKINGNLNVTGAVVAGFGGGDQVGVQTHTHGGVQTGAGNTAAPNAGT